MSVIKWTSQRRCIFNRIFQDNVLCIASPSTRWFTWICTSNRGDLVGQQYVTRYLRTSLRLKRYFPVRPIRIILDESSNQLERKKQKREKKRNRKRIYFAFVAAKFETISNWPFLERWIQGSPYRLSIITRFANFLTRWKRRRRRRT